VKPLLTAILLIFLPAGVSRLCCQDLPDVRNADVHDASESSSGATETSRPAGFFRSVFTPAAFAKLSLGALYDHSIPAIPEWGSGHDGLARRGRYRAVNQFTRGSLEYVISRYRGTNTDYTRCACAGFRRRARHAIVSEFLERRADGSPAAPVSRLAGIYGAALLSAPMLPGKYGPADVLQRSSLALASEVGFNFFQEFWPEIKRTLLRRARP